MKYRVLRGSRRIVGWGPLPSVGETVELPGTLGAQLVEQGIVEKIAQTKGSAKSAGDEDATEQRTD